MELRQLRYFRAVAEELNFGKAAVRLNLSQPPLSRQIRALEEELGFALFDRTPRGTRLTLAGSAFLETVDEVLERLEMGILKSRRVASGKAGTIRIGFRDTAMYNTVVPPRLLQFSQTQTDVEMILLPMTSAQQCDAVLRGEIDAGLVYYYPHNDELMHHTLLKDDFVVALNASHPLAARDDIVLADLAQEPFIWFPRSMTPVYYDALLEACARAGFVPRIVQHAPSVGGPVVHLVSAGMGISFVQRGATGMIRPSSVILRRVKDLDVQVVLSLIWHRQNTSPILRTLLALLRADAAESA